MARGGGFASTSWLGGWTIQVQSAAEASSARLVISHACPSTSNGHIGPFHKIGLASTIAEQARFPEFGRFAGRFPLL